MLVIALPEATAGRLDLVGGKAASRVITVDSAAGSVTSAPAEEKP